MQQLDFEIAGALRTIVIDMLVVAGWTGRDAVAVERHIAELAAVGVRRPSSVPCFYRLGASLLTHEPVIDVIGSSSSGEAEVVLLALVDGLYVTVGSDHTDRDVEVYSVAVAKQICPKPVSRQVWPFEEVESHWDELILRSWATADGRRELYQEGVLAEILPPRDLMARYLGQSGALPAGTAMYCGTLAVNGVIRAAESFEIELEDPRLHRKLCHAYRARSLENRDQG